MARKVLTGNLPSTFDELSASLEAEGFCVDHYHAGDHDLETGEKLVVHIAADGMVSGGDVGSLIWETVSPQGWDSLVADEWHE